MAKRAGEIRLDYERAIKQANSLKQIARSLQNLANREFAESMSEISHSWTGDNATAYINKCKQLKEKMLRSADKILKAAETIETIAKNTYNTEMQALSIAEARTY